MRRGSKGATLREWLMAALFGTTVLGGATAAVTALNARVATTDAITARPALMVETAPLRMIDRYLVRESFVGQIEPARETLPAAERAGLVIEVLIDEGDKVTTGQILARLDSRSLEIERTRLMAERASLDANINLAQRTTDRRAKLVGDGWASRQAHDEAKFSVAALQARRDAVTAAIAQVDLDLEKSEIRAPFAGQIADRAVDEGTVVGAGTALMRLQETARPQARIGLPADRVAEIEPGEEVTLDYAGQTLSGRVAAVTRDMEPGTRTVPVLIDLAPDAALVNGQVIRLHLDREVETRGAWVDLSALTEAERGLWSIQTVVESANGTSARREAVEILHIDGERAFIRGTFADGAEVVTAGAHRLSNGQAVALAGRG